MWANHLARESAYKAFISYSHAKDKPIAAALQGAVQKLGKPWYRRRALRIFRDDTSLSATPSLWPSIERALLDWTIGLEDALEIEFQTIREIPTKDARPPSRTHSRRHPVLLSAHAAPWRSDAALRW